MKILADASLPDLAELFPSPFEINRYQHLDQVKSLLADNQVLMCRSTLRVNADLLANSAIQYVATASSGIDHIDQNALDQLGITLLDAHGCNVQSVGDYVVATVAWLQQHQTLNGHKAGVIGAGAVGSHVIQRLQALNYNVVAFDPYRAALYPAETYCTFAELLTCDLLCLHANLHQDPFYPSLNLINRQVIERLQPGVALINASRGGIVNETDLLASKPSMLYCTDVFLNEPHINPDLIDFATLCTPHIAGHSVEAKHNAVAILSQQLHQRLGLPVTSQHHTQPPIIHQINIDTPWQNHILNLYNPYHDTQLLKQHLNKTKAFLQQRQAHNTRHDFLAVGELSTIISHSQ